MSESKHRACVHTHIPCLFGVIACYHVAGGVKAPFPCVAVECLAGSPQMFGSPVRHENIFLPIRFLGQIWTIERKRTIMAGDASERYDALVRQRPELIQQVPIKAIASYLGIAETSLSRLRNPKNRSSRKPSK